MSRNGLHIILSTLPKLGFTPLYFKNSKLIEDYNEVINKLSKEYNLNVTNMSGVEEYYVDGVHFNNEGS